MQLTVKEGEGGLAGSLIMLQAVVAIMLARHPEADDIIAKLQQFPEGLASTPKNLTLPEAAEARLQDMADAAREMLNGIADLVRQAQAVNPARR